MVGDARRGHRKGRRFRRCLANVYLHYVFDLWARQWRQRHARGDVVIVRFADDLVWASSIVTTPNGSGLICVSRFAEFDLELNDDKTRLIEFGRFAAEDRQRAGSPQA